MLNHVMGMHGIDARNDNGERFVDFCSTNHLVIGGTIFQHKPCHKVSWISPSGRTSNQIDHFAISRRFRGCLMNVRNKRGADIGNSLDHFLMVATLRLRTAAVPKNKNIVQRAPNYCIEKLKTPQVLGNFNAQISIQSTNLSSSQISTTQHWAAVKGIFRSAGDDTVGRPPRGRRKWMSENTWMLIEERNKIKCLMSGHCSEIVGRDLRTQYRPKNEAVKIEEISADLASDAEEEAFNGDIKTIYKITKQLIAVCCGVRGRALASHTDVRGFEPQCGGRLSSLTC